MIPLLRMTWPLFIVLAVILSCRSRDAGVEQKVSILATVNETAITRDDLYLVTGGDHGGNVTPAMQDAVLETLVDQELLYQEGIRLGLDKDAKYQNAVKIMEARLRQYQRAEMARRVGNTRIASTVNITNTDVDRYLEQNADRLRTEYHLWVARFANDAEAKEARTRLLAGTKFENLADRGPRHGQPTGRPTWDLGYLPWVRVPAEWSAAVDALDKGAVSEVLQGKGTGYSLIKLVDRRMNARLDLQTVRAAVMNRLRDDAVKAAYEQYVQQLKSEAKIKRFKEGR